MEQCWGKEAYAQSDSWWRGKDSSGQSTWKAQVAALNSDWIALSSSANAPSSSTAQELARRHVEWLSSIPGTPAALPGGDVRGYVLGLAEMYVADERFAVNYGGVDGAAFVRDALTAYAEREL